MIEIVVAASILSIAAVAIVAIALTLRHQKSFQDLEKQLASSKITLPLRLQAVSATGVPRQWFFAGDHFNGTQRFLALAGPKRNPNGHCLRGLDGYRRCGDFFDRCDFFR